MPLVHLEEEPVELALRFDSGPVRVWMHTLRARVTLQAHVRFVRERVGEVVARARLRTMEKQVGTMVRQRVRFGRASTRLTLTDDGRVVVYAFVYADECRRRPAAGVVLQVRSFCKLQRIQLEDKVFWTVERQFHANWSSA